MKNTIKSIFAIILMFILTASIAQTPEENHIKLVEAHNKALEHTRKINTEETLNKEARKRHVEEVGKHLANAKAIHEKLKSAISENKMAKAKIHLDAIEKYHTEASRHHTALMDELAKKNHDEKKAKEHASNLHNSLTFAEKENQMLADKATK